MAKIITVTVPPAPVEVISLSVDASPTQVVQLMIPGQQGPTGLRGPQGIPGSSNVLSIGTVTTGAIGSNASATISGVSPNQVLNLTIPRGNTGPAGPAPVLSIGTINTLAEGQAANATLTGTDLAPILNLGIPRGYGVRQGGTTGQALVKLSNTDHDTGWSTLTSASLTDSTATGRSLILAADPAAARGVLGITAIGTSVVTAADAAAVRTAIGAGTSSLIIGTTAATAKAGNYQPTAANISDSTAVGRSVLTAADAAAARTAIGAGTSSLVIGTTPGTAKAGDYQPAAANISDSTAVGRSLITAADAESGRTLLGLTDYGRDRGTGTTLPNTDLRRGDVYNHTGLGCLMVYTGSNWRQVNVSIVADLAARNAISASHAAALHDGFRVVVQSQNQENHWDGAGWRGTNPIFYGISVTNFSSVNDNNIRLVMSAKKLTDPGWPYYIRFEFTHEVSGARVNSYVIIRPDTVAPIDTNYTHAYENTSSMFMNPPNSHTFQRMRYNLTFGTNANQNGLGWVPFTGDKYFSLAYYREPGDSFLMWGSANYHLMGSIQLLPTDGLTPTIL